MRVPLFPLLSLLLFGLLAAGCASSGALDDAPEQAVGPTWQLVTVGIDAADAEATLTFDPDGRVFGMTGCNRYFGTYELASDGALTLSQVGSTRMACPPAEMAQETRFLGALNGAERVVVEGDRLMLTASGGPQLTFQSMPSDTADATLSGTVTYRPRIALPPNAVVSVRLLDVSRADAPSITFAEERLPTAGSQVPLPFSLGYDSADIQPRNRYVVRAEIFDADGVLLWTTDTAYPVLTQGAPQSEIEIVLAQVTEADVAGLVGRTWRLAEIREPSGVTISYEGEAPFTLSFGADGRYSGRADCNQYGGTFEATPGGTLRLSRGLSTLAACPNPSVSQDFFGVLNGAGRYVLAEGRLTLSNPEGGALVFERDSQGGMPPQETLQDYAYTCQSPDGPFTFRIRTGPGEIALWLPERFEGRDGGTYLVLGQVVSASGAKYQDGPVTVWTKGQEEALLEVDGEEFLSCTRAAGGSGRLLLRGTGDGWYLEVAEAGTDVRLRLVGAFEDRQATATVERSGGQAVYRADGFVVTTTDGSCTDADSGHVTDIRITVELDGRTHQGCGQKVE